MINVCELHDTGERMWEREDLSPIRRRTGFDAERDWIGVFDGARCVAWAMVLYQRRAYVDVHPDLRGRGLGTALRAWTVDRVRELGGAYAAQTINDRRTDVVAMLHAAGYTPRYTSWILRMDHHDRRRRPSLPRGRPAVIPSRRRGRAARDVRGGVLRIEDRLPSSIVTWRAMTIEREGFLHEDMVVAVDGGEIVGGAFLIETRGEIWVDKFAVPSRPSPPRDRPRDVAQVAFQRGFDRAGTRRRHLSHRLDHRRADVLRAVGMHIRQSYTHLRSISERLAVAEGFEPSGELPLHALSRRVPSAARAGHRGRVYGRLGCARARRRPQMLRSNSAAYARRPDGRRCIHRCRTTLVVPAGGVPVDHRRVVVAMAQAWSRALFASRYGRGTLTVTSHDVSTVARHVHQPVAVGAVDEAIRPQVHDHVDAGDVRPPPGPGRAGSSRRTAGSSARSPGSRAPPAPSGRPA